MSLYHTFFSKRSVHWHSLLPTLLCLLMLGGFASQPQSAQAQQLEFNSAGEVQGAEIGAPPLRNPAIRSQGQYPSPSYVLPGGPAESYSIGGMEQDYFSMNQPGPATSGDGGMGWLGRANYQAGKTVGTNQSLLNFNAMPYVFWDNTMILGDLNLYRLNSGDLGGSVGGGVRQYLPNLDRTLGAIVTYNIDGTYRENFENITLSFESRGRYLDWLSNVYLPTGLREQEVGLFFNDGSQEFVGNNIEFDQTRVRAYNLSGFDMMFGTPLPSEFAQRFDMRAYAGFYYFQHPVVDEFWGWSTKLEANVLKTVDLNLTVTNDEIFDTRVTFNAAWTFDPKKEYGSRRTTWDRMMLPTSRLYTVPKAEVATVEADIPAINPLTGDPYYVVHVNSNPTNVDDYDPTAPLGTVTNPFESIEDAVVSGPDAIPIDTYDIVFVHADSTFDSAPTIVVPEGKRFLGEGDRVGHQIVYNEFGLKLMPRANGTFNDGIFQERPLYTNLGTPGVGGDPDGPGVTFDTLLNQGGTVLSNLETEFSGFVLGNSDATDPTSGDSEDLMDDPFNTPTPGAGPIADGIVFTTLGTPVSVDFVDINGANGDGLVFDNVTGNYNLQAVIVNQSENHEMYVNGGAPNVTLSSGVVQYTGDLFETYIINRANGSANAPDGLGGAGDNHDLLVQNTTGGTINWTDVITNDIGGDGFLFNGSNSNISISSNTYLQDTRAQGVMIAPGTGGIITLAATPTNQVPPAGPTRNAITGGGVNYQTDNFNNFRIINANGNAIQIGNINNTGDPVDETFAQVIFNEAVTIDGADVNGNSIGFDPQYSGVLIANTSNSVLFNPRSDLIINYNNDAIVDPTATASAIEIFQNSTGDVTFSNNISIYNPGGSGIRITNNTGGPTDNDRSTIRFSNDQSLLEIVNANLHEGTAGAAIVIGNDTPAGPPSNSVAGSPYEYNVIFDKQVDIEDTNGMGVYANGNTGSITFNGPLEVQFDDDNTVVPDNVSLIHLLNNVGNIRFGTVRLSGVTNNDIFVPFQADGAYTDQFLGANAAVLLRDNIGTIDFGNLNTSGNTTGLFAINNRGLTIRDGNITATGRSAMEILTTIDQIDNLTNINLNTRVASSAAPDAGVHLVNVKGTANFNGGDLRTSNYGMIVNNTYVRTDELANDEVYFTRGELTVNLREDIIFSNNDIGFRGLAFDELDIIRSEFEDQNDEALLLDNMLYVQIRESQFDSNQDTPGIQQAEGGPRRRDLATVHTRYDLSLGDLEENLYYNFVVGEATPQRLVEPDNPNEFSETHAAYSILMTNTAENNKIGQPDQGITAREEGFIVNNNFFDRSTSTQNQFQSFVYYRDIDGGNSQVNMNVSMNEMNAVSTNNTTGGVIVVGGARTNPILGAIGFDHNSQPELVIDDDEGQVTGANDNMTFTASDNRMVLQEEDSVGYYFITNGDGNAFIRVFDTNNDYLTEANDPLLDNEINNPLGLDPSTYLQQYNPDLQIAGTAFRFDLEADANIGVNDVEILLTNQGSDDVTSDLTAFQFDSIRGEDTQIDLSNNTVLFDSNNPGDPVISPLGFAILGPIPDYMKFVVFDSLVEPVSISSSQNNFALYSDGALTVPILGDLIGPMFEANPERNIRGNFLINNIFLPGAN